MIHIVPKTEMERTTLVFVLNLLLTYYFGLPLAMICITVRGVVSNTGLVCATVFEQRIGVCTSIEVNFEVTGYHKLSI